MRARLLFLFSTLLLSACGGSGAGDAVPAAGPGPESPAPAPWAAPRLAAADAPSAYLTAWGDAENRDWCALLAFEDPPLPDAAVDVEVRTAQFGGGWGVAYDLPELRSAFGVAGTGVEPGPDTYDDWPHHREWRDGSHVGYGPEGGDGPRQLAYLQVAGQRCLYNVWSQLGPRHLEALLDELRLVGAPIHIED